MATATKMELAVEMTCQRCVQDIQKKLDGIQEIKTLDINLGNEQVVIETTLPSSQVIDILESTGRRATLQGHGSAISGQSHLGAAVSMLEVGPVKGVVRYLQSDRNTCIIEGTLDGLKPGKYGIAIHELGDLSDGCNSCGDRFNPYNQPHGGPADERRHVGDMGNIEADETGRAKFRLEDRLIKVWDIIGRSVVVHANADDLGRGNNPQSKIDGNSGSGIACGIIARSSGLFQNPKKFCSCDGVTIWEERDRPLAGPGRSQPHASL
ncbi:copper chaperone for superoxide dismutase-like [Ptychodera flava]|uniref:copper chaperone for superoxide dismutase-like n=1 Tax=Ptychodera flava TaxID=63121 RepID=UPI003969C36F